MRTKAASTDLLIDTFTFSNHASTVRTLLEALH